GGRGIDCQGMLLGKFCGMPCGHWKPGNGCGPAATGSMPGGITPHMVQALPSALPEFARGCTGLATCGWTATGAGWGTDRGGLCSSAMQANPKKGTANASHL